MIQSNESAIDKLRPRRQVLGSKASIEITPADYEEIRVSRDGLGLLMGIEQKFNAVLANYEEFERELLTMSLRRMLYADGQWGGFHDDIHTANRRLGNLLSSARAYTDQVQHDIKRVLGRRSDAAATASQRMADASNTIVAYRLMEALRNYAQHQSFPVRTLSFSSTRRESPRGVRVEHTATPYINVRLLTDDSRVDHTLLESLKRGEPEVALTPYLREYIATIGKLHSSLRESLRLHIDQWETCVLNAIERWEREGDGRTLALAAVKVTSVPDGEDESDPVFLFRELVEHRRFLESSLHGAQNLAREFVSGDDREGA